MCTSSGFAVGSRRKRICVRRAWKSVQFEHELISRYAFAPGSQTSTSYVFAALKPVSPAHSSITRYAMPSSS